VWMLIQDHVVGRLVVKVTLGIMCNCRKVIDLAEN